MVAKSRRRDVIALISALVVVAGLVWVVREIAASYKPDIAATVYGAYLGAVTLTVTLVACARLSRDAVSTDYFIGQIGLLHRKWLKQSAIERAARMRVIGRGVGRALSKGADHRACLIWRLTSIWTWTYSVRSLVRYPS
jgi:hypothetical protein